MNEVESWPMDLWTVHPTTSDAADGDEAEAVALVYEALAEAVEETGAEGG